MTKEEIVRNEYGKIFGTQKYDNSVNRKMNFKYFSPAMDQYAKQEAIAFAEWIAINGWYLNKIKLWSNRGDKSDNLILVLAATKSTEDLYYLFLQSK